MKRQPGILMVMWMILLLVLPRASVCATADEKKAEAKADPPKVAWAESLVTVKANGAEMTGVIVKADSKTALILTTFQRLPGDEDLSIPDGAKVTVIIRAPDGKRREIQGTSQGWLGQVFSSSGVASHTVFVEIEHVGLELSAVPIGETVPGKGQAVVVLERHCVGSKPSANLDRAKIATEIDPATNHSLVGQLSHTNLQAESLLTVHDGKGALIGIARSPGGIGGGGGGFGFGGSGGGFFSVPDPFNNSSPEIERQPTFTSVVDRAEQLRQMGVPMSDAAIELQKQRRRINTDAFGRPIQGGNLQITWSDNHKELHGFSNAHGEWTKLSIKEQDVIIPIVGKNVGAVSLDGKIAAYSPETGQWDVMTLRPGSQMPPSVSTDIVTVRDGKDYYTFAASSGMWTSPTNPDYQKHSVSLRASNSASSEKLQEAMGLVNNRAVVKSRGEGMMTISGIRHHVVAAERMVREIENESSTKNSAASLSVPATSSVGSTGLNGSLPGMRASSPGPGVGGPGHGMAGRTVGRLESQSLDLAKQLRGQTDPSADKQAQLKELVTKSLDERLRQQRTAAKRLREKLQSVEKALQSREANRERIIERRVEELLDPNVDWATLQPGSSPARLSGRLATGTAIGLPGPVHIPLGSDARFPAVASVQPAAATDGNSALSLFESLKKARSIAVDVHGPGIPEMKSQLAYWQQPIDEIRKRYGKDLSAKTREESIQATKDNLNQRKKEFNDAFGVWQATWREYETQREAKRLDVEEAKTRSDATKEKLHRIQGLMKQGIASLPESKEIETQLKLQTIELRRATNAIESIDQIRKDHPDLDPNSFDTSELLDEEQTSASLNARVDPEVVLVNFGASYCQPCQKMAPALQRMEKDKYPIRNVDITEQTDIARDHKIVRIPTMILLVDGEEAQRFVGVITEEELRKAMNDAARKQDLQRKPDARLSPSGKGV